MPRTERPLSYTKRFAFAALGLAMAATLHGCGGDLAAVVGFIGSAGGDWKQGNQTQADPRRVDIVRTCAADECKININPVNTADYFSDSFDVRYFGNVGTCPPSGTNPTPVGRVTGRRIELPSCFSGSYVTINEAVSDNGALRMFFNFGADRLLVQCGLWVDIDSDQRRFKFTTSTVNVDLTTVTGTEQTNPPTPVTLVIRDANINNVAGPFETLITSFTMGAGAPWSGSFVGVSGMELRRGSEVLRLERRPETAGARCP
jgi:hypothetical protein